MCPLVNRRALAAEQEDVLRKAGYDVNRLNSTLSTDSQLSTLNSQLQQRKLVLITGHRRENFGDGFISMVTAMKDLSEKYPGIGGTGTSIHAFMCLKNVCK